MFPTTTIPQPHPRPAASAPAPAYPMEVRDGCIVALKGLGGFHLIADARREDVVARLRDRKGREDKPFAVMYPSLAHVRVDCEVSDAEARLLTSPESPIVLLKRHPASWGIAHNVAPGNPYLGVMVSSEGACAAYYRYRRLEYAK